MKWNIERNENKITLDYESYLKNISEKVIKKLAVKSIYRISEIFKVSIKQIILDKHLIYVILNEDNVPVLFEFLYSIKTALDLYIIEREEKMKNLYQFKSMSDMEKVFDKMRINYDDEDEPVLTNDFIIEGNSSTTYGWLKNVATNIGVTNVYILQEDYDGIMDSDYQFIDTIFLDIKNIDWLSFKNEIDIMADRVTLDKNGMLLLWWD